MVTFSSQNGCFKRSAADRIMCDLILRLSLDINLTFTLPLLYVINKTTKLNILLIYYLDLFGNYS